MSFDNSCVWVVGGGLAGVEAAMQLSRRGVKVKLFEMKPKRFSEAHENPDLAELVCSNSLKSMGLGQASGLLQEELTRLGSLVIEVAKKTSVAAGQALAVERGAFSGLITELIEAEENIELVREEFLNIPADRNVIIATGPLGSATITEEISRLTGGEGLYFYDAMAPILDGDSINKEIAFAGSRYENGTPDYLNCPMTKEEFDRFYEALTKAEVVPTRDFEEEKVFQACQPIEVLAAKGEKTLCFGAMKPVGFTDPRSGKRPHAIVQLRREDKDGLRWNMVGFQTKLVYGEQERIFRLIPGLEQATFHRLGSLHRNTYVDGPRLLDSYLRLRKTPWIALAGQITGVEGYLESAAMGLWAGLNMALRLTGKTPSPPPIATAIGALLNHATTTPVKRFEPMNMNFGILPPLGQRMKDKKAAKLLRSERALLAQKEWMSEL
jgi:methylenetetrahydrofolate--tRNA-(uracil-5-)-methyltransferase